MLDDVVIGRAAPYICISITHCFLDTFLDLGLSFLPINLLGGAVCSIDQEGKCIFFRSIARFRELMLSAAQ